MPETNLSDYVEKFTNKEYNNIINNFTTASNTKYGLNISISKFELEYDLNLADALIKLGITDAFSEELALLV